MNICRRIFLIGFFCGLIPAALAAAARVVTDLHSLPALLATGTAAWALTATVLCLAIRPLHKDLQEILAATAGYLKGYVVSGIKPRGWGELGQIKRSMAELENQLCRYLEHVAGITARLFALGESINEATGRVSAASQEEAARIQEMYHRVRELAESTVFAAGLAGEALELARKTSHLTGEGSQVLEEVAASMEEIDRAMAALEKGAGKIGEIAVAMARIAEETNLLALNAAIEASRAGREGRGFAVVAEEVRALAERSAQAAREISQLVKEMEEKSKETLEAIKESMRTGSETLHAFRQIKSYVDQMTPSVQALAETFSQQHRLTTGITDRVHALAAAAEQTSATSQEVAATTHQITGLAAKFRQVVDIFCLAKEGK